MELYNVSGGLLIHPKQTATDYDSVRGLFYGTLWATLTRILPCQRTIIPSLDPER